MSQAPGGDAPDQKARQDEPELGETERFVSSLAPEERLLVRLKAELYEGSWDELVADLEARLAGRPYILKLATRIEDDLVRIERLRAFEEEHHIDLADLC